LGAEEHEVGESLRKYNRPMKNPLLFINLNFQNQKRNRLMNFQFVDKNSLD
jgi:hypothetical protein